MVQSVPLRSLPRDQMREERLEILRMFEAGAITVDEAATLLEALDRAGISPVASESTAPRGVESRQIRIRVTDSETTKAMVNLAFPLGLLKSGLDIAGQFVPEYLPKAEAIRESISAGFRGSLVDVDDGGRRVEIIVE
ncbi:MAG: hypothetical protein K0Q71_349 [Thermomicrobiales bacterium]|jgi:hypothetical protein|nr:hypothetical protein [Thermomicrobiales bacterium]